MKINYNKNLPTVEFSKLHLGDVFLDEDGDAMMKTEVGCDPVNLNTVDLRSGLMYHIKDSSKVIPCPDACLSIK